MYISSDNGQSAFRLVMGFGLSKAASMAVSSDPNSSVFSSLPGPRTQTIV
jgi:hypothetical protein